MKNLFLLCLVVSYLLGCGSPTPFARGPKTILDDPLFPEKLRNEEVLILNQEVYQKSLLPILERDCQRCHENKAGTFERAVAQVVVGKPGESELYLRATGVQGHPVIWSPESIEAQVLKDWVLGERTEIREELASSTPQEYFSTSVAPFIKQSCTGCHSDRDAYDKAKSLIVPGVPDKSELYLRASGQRHRKVWAPDSTQLSALKSWIELEK